MTSRSSQHLFGLIGLIGFGLAALARQMFLHAPSCADADCIFDFLESAEAVGLDQVVLGTADPANGVNGMEYCSAAVSATAGSQAWLVRALPNVGCAPCRTP